MAVPRIIYDFGSNNGDDLPYYLKKADRVIAVEANPALCDMMQQRFASFVEQGRLFVENCVVTADASAGGECAFYLHRRDHVFSQLPEPPVEHRSEFEKVVLPARSVASIVESHGAPHYIKIDIERYDAPILRALFEHGICPPYISAESHDVEVFSLMVAVGRYDAFKLVDGRSVPTAFRDIRVRTLNGEERHSFPEHAAGPFGDDIPGPWLTANAFVRLLAVEGLGWKDVHATRLTGDEHQMHLREREFYRRATTRMLRHAFEHVRSIARR